MFNALRMPLRTVSLCPAASCTTLTTNTGLVNVHIRSTTLHGQKCSMYTLATYTEHKNLCLM